MVPSMLEDIALKYYRMLGIPSRISRHVKWIYPVTIVTVIGIELLILFGKGVALKNIINLVMLHIILSSLLPIIIKLMVSYINLRQALNTSFFLILLGVLLEIIGVFAKIYGVMYVAIPLLGVLILKGMSNDNKNIFVLIIYSILAEIIFTIIVDFSLIQRIARICLLLFSISVSIFFILTLSKRGKDIDVFRFSSAWAKFILTGFENDMEDVFESFGTEREIDIRMLLFQRDKDNIAIVIPGIHFGPFRTIGSTLAPYLIEEELKKYNIKSIIFHGAGSHERNLVSKKEINKIVNAIRDLLQKPMEKTFLYEPFRVFNGYHEALVLPSSMVLIAISTPTVGGDDIPYGVQELAEKYSKVYGYEDAVIVDCHNLEGPMIRDLSRYKDIVIAAISKQSRQCSRVRIGYSEDEVRGYVRGLCSNTIKAMAIECDGNVYSLLYLYGNNADIGVREALRRLALSLGYKDAEVFTLDDHTCSGVAFDSPYYSVRINASLLRSAEKVLREALTDLKEATISFTKHSIKVRTMGEKIYELLELAKVIGRDVLNYLKTTLLLLYSSVIILALYEHFISIQ
ncbi:Protein of unknown function DUF2070, membrane [Ignisphaera aggregans DSM 17230]|uniref:DUF2070 domain-containing protein n=1 Tax=Ignisphaera aggregans (strain DSM 17230 / JCM 13409 / AQ1.S1) TaxID=583356 RepID=E0SQZ1_IGNAA|nr:Protein of unknown function DUF2070, membrane [Ignisphaera aggregans DSM 17230]